KETGEGAARPRLVAHQHAPGRVYLVVFECPLDGFPTRRVDHHVEADDGIAVVVMRLDQDGDGALRQAGLRMDFALDAKIFGQFALDNRYLSRLYHPDETDAVQAGELTGNVQCLEECRVFA